MLLELLVAESVTNLFPVKIIDVRGFVMSLTDKELVVHVTILVENSCPVVIDAAVTATQTRIAMRKLAK